MCLSEITIHSLQMLEILVIYLFPERVRNTLFLICASYMSANSVTKTENSH